MPAESKYQTWFLDQLAKSEFFHQKLHEWKMIEVAQEIESFPGEKVTWNFAELGISETAWNKVIHHGIKPVTVFAHPKVLKSISGAVGYYRMLAMVSQKSMSRIGINITPYEKGTLPKEKTAQQIASHLNQIISRLIEGEEHVGEREFDLWRGMAAGTQAQGSWQNAKGEQVEHLVKTLVRERLRGQGKLLADSPQGPHMELSDGRIVSFGDEPDIAFSKGDLVQAAVEVKGGIDSAGVLERLGAAMKSLNRIRETNPTAITILIVQAASLTETAQKDLELNRHIITHSFTLEDILQDQAKQNKFFELLNI